MCASDAGRSPHFPAVKFSETEQNREQQREDERQRARDLLQRLGGSDDEGEDARGRECGEEGIEVSQCDTVAKGQRQTHTFYGASQQSRSTLDRLTTPPIIPPSQLDRQVLPDFLCDYMCMYACICMRESWGGGRECAPAAFSKRVHAHCSCFLQVLDSPVASAHRTGTAGPPMSASKFKRRNNSFSDGLATPNRPTRQGSLRDVEEDLGASKQESGAESDDFSDLRGSGLQEEEEDLELIYDPILNCYWDPQSNKYYELKNP